ncbi:MAG TPA: HupE/UreJ family protein [Burkholderiales bacterium]|nr:HupE/UreJ family protein [Burkholderiales bacterium]
MSRRNPAGQLRIDPALFAVLLFAPALAFAHVDQGEIGGGFLSGMAHPVLGLDHVVAMVAVGLWGAQLGSPAIWVLPVTFPLVMAFGGLLGLLGVPIPAVEIGIALSAIVLGAMVALAARPPLWVAGLLVGLFAIFHGHAHGAELPEAANAIAYSVGFVIATGLLHAVGILIGVANRWRRGAQGLRVGGGAIAASGVYFLVAHLA